MKYTSLFAGLLFSLVSLADDSAPDCGDAELVASTIASDVIQYSCYFGSRKVRTVLIKSGIRVFDGQYNETGELHGPFAMLTVDGGIWLKGNYRNGVKVGRWMEFDAETMKAQEVVHPD